MTEQAIGRDPCAVAERLKLRPHDVRRDEHVARDRAEAAIGGGEHAARVADCPRELADAVGDDLRMLDVVGRDVDHPDDQAEVLGRGEPLERAQLCCCRGLPAGRYSAPTLAR